MNNYKVITSVPSITFEVMGETEEDALDIANVVLDTLEIIKVEGM
jgi:hypothetical protein